MCRRKRQFVLERSVVQWRGGLTIGRMDETLFRHTCVLCHRFKANSKRVLLKKSYIFFRLPKTLGLLLHYCINKMGAL